MKVTFSCNAVRVNGKPIGYFTQLFSGNWLACFTHNNLKYTRTATRLNYLREIDSSVLNDNE